MFEEVRGNTKVAPHDSDIIKLMVYTCICVCADVKAWIHDTLTSTIRQRM